MEKAEWFQRNVIVRNVLRLSHWQKATVVPKRLRAKGYWPQKAGVARPPNAT